MTISPTNDTVSFANSTGTTQEAQGVAIMAVTPIPGSDTVSYVDSAGITREAIGVVVLAGGGGSLPDGTASVADASTVQVSNFGGVDPHDGTASVTGNQLETISLGTDATILDSTDTVSVRNSAVSDNKNATPLITNGILQGVNLAATVAFVDQGDAVVVQNSAGAAVAGTHPATVTNGSLARVNLAASIAPVANGSQTIRDAAAVPKTSTATRVVSAGAITTTTLAGTDCIVKNGDSFTTVDGGTLTVVVTAGVPTFTYTAP